MYITPCPYKSNTKKQRYLRIVNVSDEAIELATSLLK